MTWANGSTSSLPSGKPLKFESQPGGHHGHFKILSNLLDEIEQTAIGIPAAFGAIAKTTYGDVQHALTGKGKEFHLDNMVGDIAKTTVKGIEQRWKPLFTGHLNDWWNGVEKDPLGTLLDLSTVVTLGGGALAKAGTEAAKAGSEGFLTKAAGLSKTGHIDDAIAAQKALDTEGIHPHSTHESFARADIKVLGGVVDHEGNVWSGPTAHLRTGTKDVELPLAKNPVLRKRQEAIVALGNKFQSAPLIGSHIRGTRLAAKRIESEATRKAVTATMVADKLYDGLTDAEKKAAELVDFAHQPATRAQFIDHYARREAQVADEIAKLDDKAKLTGTGAKTVLAAKHIQERLAALKDDASWEHAADPSQWSDGFRKFMAATEVASKETTRRQWEMGGRTYRGKPVSFDDYLDIQRTRQSRHVNDPELDQLTGDDTIEPADLAQYMRDQGISEHAYVRPHIAAPEAAKHRNVGEVRVGHNGVTKPVNTRGKQNNFLLFDDAADVLHPGTVTLAAKQTIMHRAEVKKFRFIMDHGKTVQTQADVPKGWVMVEQDRVGKHLDAIESWLNNDARVVFGDNEDIAAVAAQFGELRDRVGNGALAVPKAMASELLKQVKDANRFIETYDKATGAWRHLALTAKPSWITGNLVGGVTLLATTHGTIKSAAGLFEAARMGARGASADAIIPDAVGAGFFRSTLEEAARRKGHSLADSKLSFLQKPAGGIKALSDWMLNVNAAVSDDWVRRAAFRIEIKPHVKRIMAETGMDFETAALEWLKNPTVVDHLAQKVMGDLVDFHSLTGFERTYMRRLMPFYSWIRGATGRTWRLARDEPEKAWAGFNLSSYGVDQNEQDYGPLADFAKGLVGIGGKDAKGFQRIIATNSLNPFGTAGDVAGMAKSVLLGDTQVGGGNPASNLNPMLKALVEAIGNSDTFYGTPVDKNGDMSYLARYGKQLVGNIPQVRLAQKAAGALGKDDGFQPLYKKDLLDLLLSYGAIPTKQMDVNQMNIRARAQQAGQNAPLV